MTQDKAQAKIIQVLEQCKPTDRVAIMDNLELSYCRVCGADVVETGGQCEKCEKGT